MKSFFLFGILTLLFFSTSYGQKDTEFWFVAPEVTSLHGDRPIYLRLTSFAQSSNVKISQPAQPGFSINVNIPAHGTYSVDLTSYIDIIENKPANHINPYGLLIQSTTPITAYYDEANEWNSDIFSLKGKNSLGTEFYVPASNISNSSKFDGRNAFDIVATENNTTIRITPSNDIVGHAKDVTFTVVLNRGETFSSVAISQNGDEHLGGSKITSDKPIAVTVKDDSVVIGTAIDLNGDQIVPTNVIGREYIIVSGYFSGFNDIVSIISPTDNNKVEINSNSNYSYITANKGIPARFGMSPSDPVVYLKSDKPIYVLHTTGFGTESGSALLPPIRCTGSREVAFTRNTSQRLSLTIVTEDGAQGSFAIDGNATLIPASQFKSVPGTANPAMVYARTLYTISQLPTGSHLVTNSKGNFHLGMIIEGDTQQGCSYGYFSDYADVYLGPDATICTGTRKTLDAGAGKQSYEWSTGDTTQTIEVSLAGTYQVTTNSSGCIMKDTIVVATLPSPAVDAGPVDSIEQAASVTLSGTASSLFPPSNYTWSPQSSIISGETTLTPTTGPLTHNTIFTLQVTDRNGCSTSDSVMIAVDPGPCVLGHILNDDISVCAGTVIELASKPVLTYHWSPGDGLNDSAIQNPWVIIDSTRTFYLHTTEFSKNLITNPDFELGNTGFETDYTYCNSNNCLWTLGDNGYSIGTDASYFVNAYFSGRDHTTGYGKFMIVNGGRSSLKVWKQTIPVAQNTTYTLGVWISRMNTYDTAQIRLSINGSQLGAIFNPPVVTNKWEQVLRTWNSGMQTNATVEIVDIKSSVIGNDFGLDDIAFGRILACADSVTITASKKVSLGQDTVISPGQQLLLSPSGGPFSRYNWNTGDTIQTTSINEAGKYWLLATDPIGCVSHDTINVRLNNSYLVFPNAFTPNDDGDNEIFRPRSNNLSKFHMAIYNRWGELMFETDDAETGWNGRKSGKDCPIGLYVYVATYEFKYQEETKSARGSFTLIR